MKKRDYYEVLGVAKEASGRYQNEDYFTKD